MTEVGGRVVVTLGATEGMAVGLVLVDVGASLHSLISKVSTDSRSGQDGDGSLSY